MRLSKETSAQFIDGNVNAFLKVLSLLIFGALIHNSSSNSLYSIFVPLYKTITRMRKPSLELIMTTFMWVNNHY